MEINWTKVLAETLVKPHKHGDNWCYRMDCTETQLATEIK